MSIPNFFVKNSQSYFIEPGSINFIPAWIMLLIAVLAIALAFPAKFAKKGRPIDPFLLAFISGSLMPAFDDLLTFVFGPPFAHHSLFHSVLTGPLITYLLFYFLGKKKIATYAVIGNLTHTFFNFSLDTVALFFPVTYEEWGLTNIIFVNTYWIKAFVYPFLLTAFSVAILRYFKTQK